jgi:hypothetical protein
VLEQQQLHRVGDDAEDIGAFPILDGIERRAQGVLCQGEGRAREEGGGDQCGCGDSHAEEIIASRTGPTVVER